MFREAALGSRLSALSRRPLPPHRAPAGMSRVNNSSAPMRRRPSHRQSPFSFSFLIRINDIAKRKIAGMSARTRTHTHARRLAACPLTFAFWRQSATAAAIMFWRQFALYKPPLKCRRYKFISGRLFVSLYFECSVDGAKLQIKSTLLEEGCVDFHNKNLDQTCTT